MITFITDSDIDNQLSSTSENPIQNKVVYDALTSLSQQIETLNTTADNIIELQEQYIGGGDV